MKVIISAILMLTCTSVMAQNKKDGTPDMRYKANKEIYGNTYSPPSNSQSNYSEPRSTQPNYSQPNYPEPRQERNYENGGQLRMQNGYMKRDGSYVEPHIKTTPDNNQWNNKSAWDSK